jgi:hypothetical protein
MSSFFNFNFSGAFATKVYVHFLNRLKILDLPYHTGTQYGLFQEKIFTSQKGCFSICGHKTPIKEEIIQNKEKCTNSKIVLVIFSGSIPNTLSP